MQSLKLDLSLSIDAEDGERQVCDLCFCKSTTINEIHDSLPHTCADFISLVFKFLFSPTPRRDIDGSSLLVAGGEVGSNPFEPCAHALPYRMLIPSLCCSLGKGGKMGKDEEDVGKIYFYSGEE
jgi:hypothetical protein